MDTRYILECILNKTDFLYYTIALCLFNTFYFGHWCNVIHLVVYLNLDIQSVFRMIFIQLPLPV